MQIDVYKERYPEQVETQVVRLFTVAFSAPPRFEQWDEPSAREAIRKDYDPDAILVAAFSGERLTGFCCGLPISRSSIASDILAHAGESAGFYLSNIAVDQTVRGRGLGRRLLAAFLDETEKSHAVCVARTREDAAAVRRLFVKNGFEQKGGYEAVVGSSVARRLFYVKRFRRQG